MWRVWRLCLHIHLICQANVLVFLLICAVQVIMGRGNKFNEIGTVRIPWWRKCECISSVNHTTSAFISLFTYPLQIANNGIKHQTHSWVISQGIEQYWWLYWITQQGMLPPLLFTKMMLTSDQHYIKIWYQYWFKS